MRSHGICPSLPDLLIKLPSRLFHVVANGRISFFYMANIPFCVYIYMPGFCYLFICQWTLRLWSCMDVRAGLWRRLSTEELMRLNCGVGEDSWESLGLQGDPIGRTDVEAETPILWPPDAKSWLIGKDPDAGKDWGQEKGTTEDEMVAWHHWELVTDREAWRAAVHGVTKSPTGGPNWTEFSKNLNFVFKVK